MTEIARMATSDEQIDAAIEEARRFAKIDRKVIRATYSAGTDSIILLLENGVTHSIPRRLLQGLTDANPEDLNRIELLGQGTGLYWPAMDVAHLVTGLLAGVYGSAKWMEQLQFEIENSRLSA